MLATKIIIGFVPSFPKYSSCEPGAAVIIVDGVMLNDLCNPYSFTPVYKQGFFALIKSNQTFQRTAKKSALQTSETVVENYLRSVVTIPENCLNRLVGCRTVPGGMEQAKTVRFSGLLRGPTLGSPGQWMTSKQTKHLCHCCTDRYNHTGL